MENQGAHAIFWVLTVPFALIFLHIFKKESYTEKGMLDDGQMIAAKRLSENSSQGLIKFKNEVSCIAKLQHRNLVTLLGAALKSLDLYIFDGLTSMSLGWSKRYNMRYGEGERERVRFTE